MPTVLDQENSELNQIERAVAIALDAHTAQTDKADETYLLHPLRVMQSCESEDAKVAALLHDVVEDSQWTLDELQDVGFSDTVVTALDCLTKRDGEDYDEFSGRASENEIAREVKLADLHDNMDLTRLDPGRPST